MNIGSDLIPSCYTGEIRRMNRVAQTNLPKTVLYRQRVLLYLFLMSLAGRRYIPTVICETFIFDRAVLCNVQGSLLL
ncbi:unnamed protein product [Lathyrus sativus]|nr:unnamed protein product [Lathyrus sativus]